MHSIKVSTSALFNAVSRVPCGLPCQVPTHDTTPTDVITSSCLFQEKHHNIASETLVAVLSTCKQGCIRNILLALGNVYVTWFPNSFFRSSFDIQTQNNNNNNTLLPTQPLPPFPLDYQSHNAFLKRRTACFSLLAFSGICTRVL
jgi:hypothetical protein